jgi:class 3 adenylate cyclase
VGLKDDLQDSVRKTFRAAWTERNGREVPSDTSVTLGNDGIKLEAAVLYADLADSTGMVAQFTAQSAGEIYKTFLHCAAKIIEDDSGVVTAYDGDRIMGVYLGDNKRTKAMRSALRIKWAVSNIVQKQMVEFYSHRTYTVRHVVGIDVGELLVAKTGVRGANDLVWVGRAANVAAKLSSFPHQFSSYVTSSVYDSANDSVVSFQGHNMWGISSLLTPDGRVVYQSNEDWPIV